MLVPFVIITGIFPQPAFLPFSFVDCRYEYVFIYTQVFIFM